MAGKRNAPKAASSEENVTAEAKKAGKRAKVKPIEQEEKPALEISYVDEEVEAMSSEMSEEAVDLARTNLARRPQRRENTGGEDTVFIGDPIDINITKKRWPYRYLTQTQGGTDSATPISKDEKSQARRHYIKAKVDGADFCLGNAAYVMYFGGAPTAYSQMKIDELRDMWIKFVQEYKLEDEEG